MIATRVIRGGHAMWAENGSKIAQSRVPHGSLYIDIAHALPMLHAVWAKTRQISQSRHRLTILCFACLSTGFLCRSNSQLGWPQTRFGTDQKFRVGRPWKAVCRTRIQILKEKCILRIPLSSDFLQITVYCFYIITTFSTWFTVLSSNSFEFGLLADHSILLLYDNNIFHVLYRYNNQ